MKKLHKTKLAVILFVFFLRKSTSNSISQSDDLSGCYNIANNGAKFQFFCSNTQYLFNETCSVSALSKALKNINSSAVTKLRYSGCQMTGLYYVLKEFKNVNDQCLHFLAISWNNKYEMHRRANQTGHGQCRVLCVEKWNARNALW